jgi:hypothetical protein
MEIELGDRVKDKISGFEGIVVARTQYLESCDQVLIRSEKLEGGETKSAWFDVPWVTVTKKQVHKPTAAIESASGERRSGGGVRSHSR